MARSLYDNAKELMWTTGLGLNTDTIQATLIDVADYTVNLATHSTESTDVPSAAKVAVATLSSVTYTDGVFDAADTTFSSVTGDSCEAIIIHNDTDDKLIAYLDGYSITPSGVDIEVIWHTDGIIVI